MSEYYNRYLPNPLLKPDGTIVRDAEDWEKQKEYLRSVAQECMYGTWPGKAERVTSELTSSEIVFDGKGIRERVLLTVTYRGEDFNMDLGICRPNDDNKHPVIISNAITHDTTGRFANDAGETLVSRGYALVAFLMNDLVLDVQIAKFLNLPMDENKKFPKLPCATIMAWGWGHSVTADYVETCSYAGPLICTGGSRGGKAALCCAIFDDRFAVAAPTIAGCGGTGSARFCGTTDGARQDSVRTETIGCITSVFPDWFNERYATYGPHEEPFVIDDKVNHFPLDANVLRAMVAPRAVFSSDGEEDHWSNPFGTQLAWMAAQPVFDMLGVPGSNCFHIRPGVHGYDPQDWEAMLDFCDQMFGIGKHPEHADLNKPYFDVDIKQYADWIG